VKAGAQRSISADLIFFGPFLYQDKKGLAPAAIERDDVKLRKEADFEATRHCISADLMLFAVVCFL